MICTTFRLGVRIADSRLEQRQHQRSSEGRSSVVGFSLTHCLHFFLFLFACCAPRPLDARVVDVDGPAKGSDSEARPVRPPAQRRDGVHVLHVADPGFFPGPRPRCIQRCCCWSVCIVSPGGTRVCLLLEAAVEKFVPSPWLSSSLPLALPLAFAVQVQTTLCYRSTT